MREERLRALGAGLPDLRRRGAAIAALPSLGLLTLAGLTPGEWSRSWHEASGEGDLAALAEEVLATRPTLCALSALSASIAEAYRLADALRAAGARVVLGGLHVTACPEEAAGHADAVVVGEGEPVWAALLEDAARGQLRPRYRAGAPFDLGLAPVPAWELLGDAGARPRWTLQSARGCPLACAFCGASRLLGPFREKPLARIEAELAAIRARDPRPVIELADDNTFAGPRDPAALADALGQAGARWFTEVDWRLGERPGAGRALAEQGCVQVLVGIESLVAPYAGMGPKAAPPERVLDALRALQEQGLVVTGCYVVGADGETRASLDALARAILDGPLAEVQLTLQTPFPGTALRRRLQAEGRLLDGVGWSSYTLFDLVYRPDPLPPAELEAGFLELLQAVFAPAAAARRAAIRREVLRRRGEEPAT